MVFPFQPQEDCFKLQILVLLLAHIIKVLLRQELELRIILIDDLTLILTTFLPETDIDVSLLTFLRKIYINLISRDEMTNLKQDSWL